MNQGKIVKSLYYMSLIKVIYNMQKFAIFLSLCYNKVPYLIIRSFIIKILKFEEIIK